MANAHIERLHLPEVVHSLDLRVVDGEAVAILGLGHAGNTHLMRAIAGLEPLADGTIAIDGAPVHTLPAGRRGVAMVFRDFALYPHLDVRDNIAFPLRARGIPERELRDRIDDMANQLSLTGCLGAAPADLFAAQRLRVAIARAVAPRPSLLLIDDAFAELPNTDRIELRGLLRRLQRSSRLTTIHAMSDSIEAMSVADRIAIVKDGDLQQVDTPTFLYTNPDNVAVAEALGEPRINLIEGTLAGDRLRIADQEIRLGSAPEPATATDVLIGVRPEAFDVNADPGNAILAVLDPSSRESFGSHAIVEGHVGEYPVRVRLSGGPADVPRRAYAPATALVLFRRGDGIRIALP